MAVTSIWKVEGWLGKVLGYAMNPDKTEGAAPEEYEARGIGQALLYVADPDKTEQQLFVTGVNCLPETALAEMNATKRQYGKTGGILAFHGYQAFAPGEADPRTAHDIGVTLARELWGARFEVVVATHLDKEHLHNHFVINSVSYADGKRFHRDNACYRRMREASDRLCAERGLSVIENPEPGRSKHYAEWAAEREGRPTWRAIVKQDVDEAIEKATTDKQFYANLRAIGYDIKTGKDISVRPPGKERFVRLARNFGEDYTYEGVTRRILANTQPRAAIQGSPRPKPRPQKRKVALPRGSIAALYRHYLYLFDAYPKDNSTGRMHFLLREDLRHFDRISEEMRLIEREGIQTLPELNAYRQTASDRIANLVGERTRQRAQMRENPERADAHKRRIDEINVSLKALRKEVRLCESIGKRSKDMPARIERIEGERTVNKQEKEAAHGRNGAGGRADREDGARR